MTTRLLCAFLFLLSSAFSQAAFQGKRHAILIGNGEYAKLGKVAASAPNLDLLEGALQGAGFGITRLRNLETSALEPLVAGKHPALQAIQPGDACLLYYSGFAIQYRRDNFLLPVDYEPSTALSAVPTKAASLTAILDALAERKPGLRILIVDAPWEIPEGIAMSGPGLGVPQVQGTEVVVVHAAAPEETVPLSQAEEPSAFTRALVEVIRKPGVPLLDVFTQVQRALSQARPPQRPLVLPNVTATFYFREPLEETRPVAAVKHVVKRNRKDRQDYVWVEPGTFLMGCVPGDDECEKNEKPQHQVTISKGFWMGANEVTVLAYQRYIADSPKTRKWPKEPPADDKNRRITDRPIGGATWEEANEFCKWAGGRLPSEAEWEYAARSGRKNEIYPLTFENSRDRANFYGKHGNDLFDEVANVRSFDASPWGFWDLAGNLWEWCNDWFSETYFAESPERDPPGPASGSRHVIRGGSWYSDARKHLRISIRRPGQFGNTVGFRCVLENTDATKSLLE